MILLVDTSGTDDDVEAWCAKQRATILAESRAAPAPQPSTATHVTATTPPATDASPSTATPPSPTAKPPTPTIVPNSQVEEITL
jgi:hypothetical protein